MRLEDFQALLSNNPEDSVVFLLLIIFRPLGLMYGFTLFAWGFGQGLVIRASIAFSLGIVVFAHMPSTFISFADSATIQNILITLIIEFLIGFGLGVLASAPFTALQYAGAITDSYRGENNSGLQDPKGGTLTTFGVLYYVAAAVTFCQIGGFYMLVENLYATYVFWPTGERDLALSAGSWLQAVKLVERSLISGLIIAAPLLIIFYSIDFALAIAMKLAPRFNLYENSFMFKNVAAIATLPLLAIYLVRISDETVSYIFVSVSLLGGILQ